jgi:hypothetical protein
MKILLAAIGLIFALLLGREGWPLVRAMKLGVTSPASEMTESVPSLDSFSGASVGLAAVRQEADRLLVIYCESPEQAASTAQAQSSNRSTQVMADNAPVAAHSGATPIAIIRAEVEDLATHVNANLMTVYHREGRCGQFLDCYLYLVQSFSDRAAVTLWSRTAVECARKSNRVEELADALRHQLRFHATPRWKVILTMALEQLEAQSAPVAEGRGQ